MVKWKDLEKGGLEEDIKVIRDDQQGLREKQLDIMERMLESKERIEKLEKKVEELYKILRLDRKIKRLLGQNRFKKCIYSLQGYCQEEGHAVDPKTVSVNTVEKDGKFYPQITWIDCQVCDRYSFGKQ